MYLGPIVRLTMSTSLNVELTIGGNNISAKVIPIFLTRWMLDINGIDATRMLYSLQIPCNHSATVALTK